MSQAKIYCFRSLAILGQKQDKIKWNQTHDEIFEDVKRLVTTNPVLAYYNPEEDLVIQCDSSGTGVGAALMQNDQPIAYASRAFADTETRYAPIYRKGNVGSRVFIRTVTSVYIWSAHRGIQRP